MEIPVSVIAFPKTQQRNWNPAKESHLRIYTEVDQGREKKLNNPRFKNLAAGQRGRPLPSPRAFLYQISVAQDLWVPPCSAIRKHHHSAQGAKERKSHLLQAATKKVSKFRSNRSVLNTPPRWHASRPNLFVISELDGDERVLRSFNLVSSGFRSQPKVPFCFLAFTEQNLWKEASISEQINWERRQSTLKRRKDLRPAGESKMWRKSGKERRKIEKRQEVKASHFMQLEKATDRRLL